MLVHDGPRWVGREREFVAAVTHGQRERARLRAIKAAEKDRHEQRGKLVVRNGSRDDAVDPFADVRCSKSAAFPLGFNECQTIHPAKLAAASAKAISKPCRALEWLPD